MKATKQLRRKELAAAISMLLVLPASALAQDQEQDSNISMEDDLITEEVIVTGIRRGLMNSIDIKGTSNSIVEAVSAEDIGKLPDVSITDSLARLPGVTAQRLNGRSQVLSVRGLAPDFTTALLNGRPQVSSGDNRGVEIDQYPSEMITEVAVDRSVPRKTHSVAPSVIRSPSRNATAAHGASLTIVPLRLPRSARWYCRASAS